MKKGIFALALALFSTITLASCNQNNKKVAFENYSSSQTETTFNNEKSKFEGKIKEYIGDYIYETTSYSEKTQTSQYEDNNDSKSVIKETTIYSSTKKVDFDKEIYTSSKKSTKTSTLKSVSETTKHTDKTSNESMIQRDGGEKYITISHTDKTYYTPSSYNFYNLNTLSAIDFIEAFDSTLAPLSDADVKYYIDNNIYTMIVEYNVEDDNSETTKKETTQVIFEDDKIIVKTESSSIETETTEEKLITTVEEYENSQITITYKDIEIKFFDYDDYKCLDEEDE